MGKEVNICKLFCIISTIILLVVLSTSSAFSAPELEVEEKSSYIYWFSYPGESGEMLASQPERFKGTETELDTDILGENPSGVKLYVMDKDTGNVAIIDYKPVAEGDETKPIKLEKKDFEYVRNVELKVVSEDGAPLESGAVEITDGRNTAMRAVITPADQGVARFRDVATGEINVKVYAEGLKRTIDSDFELPIDRKTSGFAREIKVAGDVNTLDIVKDTEAAGSGDKAAKGETKTAGGGPDSVVQILAGLIFLAIIGGIIFAIVKAKGTGAKRALEGLGVQFPSNQQNTGQGGAQSTSDVTTVAGASFEPNVCQYCGGQKDASGNCACALGPGGVPYPSQASSQSAGPRLVGMQGSYAGQVFDISKSPSVIGREPGNDVSLSSDSTISRRHAIIYQENGEFFVKDEGSSNGTFVNGGRITEQKLTSGDEVQLGGTRFRFEA